MSERKNKVAFLVVLIIKPIVFIYDIKSPRGRERVWNAISQECFENTTYNVFRIIKTSSCFTIVIEMLFGSVLCKYSAIRHYDIKQRAGPCVYTFMEARCQ